MDERLRRRRGFTLIELLVVILIILLVSAVTLPTVIPAITHRQVSEAARIFQGALAGARDTAINNNAIEEVVVLTGGFSPEYGRIMSGAVNVITREGTKQYSGALESVTDVLSGNWVGAPMTDYNVYDASFGGPVLPGKENLTFYVSGERRWQGDRGSPFMPNIFKNDLETRGFSGNRLPSNSASGYTFQGKLNWQPSDRLTFKAGGLGSQEDWREYLRQYLFNLSHAPRYLDRSESYFVSGNHVLSKRTFYNVAVNYNLTQRKFGDGLAFDNLNPQYQQVGQLRNVALHGDKGNAHLRHGIVAAAAQVAETHHILQNLRQRRAQSDVGKAFRRRAVERHPEHVELCRDQLAGQHFIEQRAVGDQLNARPQRFSLGDHRHDVPVRQRFPEAAKEHHGRRREGAQSLDDTRECGPAHAAERLRPHVAHAGDTVEIAAIRRFNVHLGQVGDGPAHAKSIEVIVNPDFCVWYQAITRCQLRRQREPPILFNASTYARF
jgi:prepilin-type N-terminal cleavage/methylation domain-containing protein